MFEGSGSTLKLFAKISFVLGTVVSMVTGFIILLSSAVGWLVFFLGPVFSFLSVLPMYTLGEVHESNREIKRLLHGNGKSFENKSEPESEITINDISVGEASKRPASYNADGSWRCTCGRENQTYISSCVCGANKWDSHNKD